MAFDRYAYVGNNPVNRMDPMGLSSQDTILLACGMGCDLSGMGLYQVNEIWRNNTDPNFIATTDAGN